MASRPHKDYEAKGYIYFPIGMTVDIPASKPKKKSKIRYYLFCIRWLWKNREWENTRQKFKAMEKAYKEMVSTDK